MVSATTMVLNMAQRIGVLDGGGELGRGLLQLAGRIAEERRQNLERLRHHATSIGVLARLAPDLGVPNRLVSLVPPEQPLPNVKPHEPRRS